MGNAAAVACDCHMSSPPDVAAETAATRGITASRAAFLVRMTCITCVGQIFVALAWKVSIYQST